MKSSCSSLAALLFGLSSLIAPASQVATPDFSWLRTTRGGGADIGVEIWSDLAGNTFTVGTFESISLDLGDGILLTNASQTTTPLKDMFIIKCRADGALDWAKRIGGADSDTVSGIALDSQQNIYLAGTFGTNLPFGGFTLTNHSPPGNAGIFVAKLNLSGDLLWARAADSGLAQFGSGVTVDQAGTCWVTGRFSGTNSFGPFTLISRGNTDALLLKYDASGNLLWARSGGGAHVDQGTAVAVDASGNAVLLANIRSTDAAFGSFVFSTSGTADADVVLAKYDPAGNVVWAKQYGGTGIDSATSMARDSSGNYFVTGSFTSASLVFGGDTLTNGSLFSDVFLAKLDPDGNALWARAAHGPFAEAGSSVAADFAGNCYVAGFFQSTNLIFDTLTLTNSETGLFVAADAFIAKFDADGNLLWAAQPVGPDEQRAFGIAVDANANAYVTGWTQGTNILFGSFATTNTYLDLFVARLESDFPVLRIDLAGTNALVSWPAKHTGFTLESSTNFHTWNPVPGEPGSVNGRNVNTNGATGSRFFRLKK